ncbi:iron-sulfur cluster carrier protein ApbC [Pseudaeromonas paramecii]|uniref:Iron-sulfur cluster carrier protein n=1 Tax=Pseudaeromonas paramecii TaxID=2138166 RepID=A0ABP8PV90_9GAMM
MSATLDAVRSLLVAAQPDDWPHGWLASRTRLVAEGTSLTLTLTLPFAGTGALDELQASLTPSLLAMGWQDLRWQWRCQVAPLAPSAGLPLLSGVKNIVAVASGKGGVGKSTTAVNLALALAAEGASVGLLDGDLYGPSVPLMLGLTGQRPDSPDGQRMRPLSRFGIKINSIGFLVPDSEAVIWRGPMASKALGQLLHETDWGSLDYLVVDLPPGTGDIQLSMAQQVPTTGVLMVTTPQDVALLDVRKGLAMFAKVGVPVVGLVENMSYHRCSACGHHEPLFGEGGGARLAAELDLPLLAQFPLLLGVRQAMDAGVPPAVAEPAGELAQSYRALARALAARLYFQGKEIPESLAITRLG